MQWQKKKNCLYHLYIFFFGNIILLFFSPSLRYNRHITLYKFQIENVMIWYTYMLWNDSHNKVNRPITSYDYNVCVCICVWWKHLRSTLLATFQYMNTVLLTIVTILNIRSTEFIHLIMEICTIWLTSPHSCPLLAPSNHHSLEFGFL